jgi:hypothetical protein
MHFLLFSIFQFFNSLLFISILLFCCLFIKFYVVFLYSWIYIIHVMLYTFLCSHDVWFYKFSFSFFTFVHIVIN